MPNKTSNQQFLKQLNRQKILRMLIDTKGSTKQELVTMLSLSLPTVNQNIAELMDLGLVYESGAVGNTGGRNAKTYSVCSLSRIAVGLNITRTNVIAVAVDLYGKIVEVQKINQPFKLDDEYAKSLAQLVENVVLASHVDSSCVLGVGIAVPGLVTDDKKTIYYGEILNCTGCTISDFAKYIPYPSFLENDANAAGFAEIWNMDMPEHAFYFSLCNNIGGSILIRNEIYSGLHQRAGEIGHMTIEPNGKKCYCGKQGCFETYCAATVLSDLTNGDLDAFFDLVQNGEDKACSEFDKYLQKLAIAVNNIHMLFDCCVILGGYVGARMEPYAERLRKIVAERNTFGVSSEDIRICHYQKEAPAAGAALPFIDNFLENL